MFRIVQAKIEPSEMRLAAAGGFVTFEGRVRDHNDGRTVTGLEYEAFVEMAESQGKALLAEARAAFDILDARAAHRIGRLEIGDVAVWIGVSAVHRADAFRACEWIIDEIKERLPIWKKEYYSGGDSGWVGAPEALPSAETIPDPRG
ncbi:MAG TPA: molybdenum cofactor biosynthesis protein MoaE [Armatimonadota bacterium]|jgi:molybdopterin synthase catalytic subunit